MRPEDCSEVDSGVQAPAAAAAKAAEADRAEGGDGLCGVMVLVMFPGQGIRMRGALRLPRFSAMALAWGAAGLAVAAAAGEWDGGRLAACLLDELRPCTRLIMGCPVQGAGKQESDVCRNVVSTEEH